MTSSLVLSFQFLGDRFHGRADGDEPEWPPSPLRAYQALVAAAATSSRGRPLSSDAHAALTWLEGVNAAKAPEIVAPVAHASSSALTLYVPNNAMDLVGRAWSRGVSSTRAGDDASPATHRTMKTVRPTRFRDGDTVSYVLVLGHDVSPDVARHVETIAAIARHVIALGWGIDVVSARADVLAEREIEALPGERWQDGPARSGGHRVPVTGTLEALEARHRGFLARVQGSVWRAPPALTRYRLVSYRRATDPISRPYAAFAIRDAAASERFRAFDTARETVVVAGRLRDATHRAALAAKAGQWPPTEIARFVLGHAEARGAAHEAAGPRRFAYLPVPTLHARGPGDESAGAIRRVLLTSFADDCDGEIAWAASALAGVELLDEETREPVALLEALSGDDAACARCAPPRGASVWTSVTPVILPGHDDRKRLRARREDEGDAMARRRAVLRRDARTDALLRKAIVQAGIDETLAAHAAITWQGPGLLAGVAHASTYRVPHHLARSPRLHVRIAWRTPGGEPLVMPGPLCIGSGRFYGLGLLVAER